MRRLIATAALVASGFASAVLADTTPPELVSWTASPDIVQVVSRGEVRVDFEFFDPSGFDLDDLIWNFNVVAAIEVACSTSLAGYATGSCIEEIDGFPISVNIAGGNNLVGTAYFLPPQDATTGNYYVQFDGLRDRAGNLFGSSPSADLIYKEGPVFFVCGADGVGCPTSDSTGDGYATGGNSDDTSDDSSASGNGLAGDDPCSGDGYNPNCSDSGSDSSDDAGTADDCANVTGYNPNCSDSGSDSASSDSGGTSSGSGSSSTGSGTVSPGSGSSSSDDASDTSGTVSSLGVTLEEPAVGLVHMGVGNLRGWAGCC